MTLAQAEAMRRRVVAVHRLRHSGLVQDCAVCIERLRVLTKAMKRVVDAGGDS